LKELNLPEYSFRIVEHEGNRMILDTQRRKFVKLTPEEWVRQNFVQYLIREGSYPPGLIGIEIPLLYNRLKKRVDILVHDRNGQPVMIVECKSYDVPVDDPVFEQIAIYNMKFNVPCLVVTNGLRHYACKMKGEGEKPEYLLAIPLYEELLNMVQ
jgi:hypothetical protein